MGITTKITEVRGRISPWRVKWLTIKGDTKCRFFRTRMDAENFQPTGLEEGRQKWSNPISACNENKKEKDEFKSFAFSMEERFAFSLYKAKCEKLHIDHIRGLESIFKVHEYEMKEKGGMMVISGAIMRYMEYMKEKNLRPITISTTHTELHKFMGDDPLKFISEYTNNDLLQWITQYKMETTRRKVKSCIVGFFKFCSHKFRRWCEPSIIKDLTWDNIIRDEERVAFFTVDQADKFIHSLPKEYQLGAALGLFAGIRPHEILRMQWSYEGDDGHTYGIDTENKIISLSGSWTKTRKFRKLQNLPDNLWEWIHYCRKEDSKSNMIVPITHKTYKRTLLHYRKKVGVTRPTWDILRHSFGTYGYFRGLEWCLDTMGHVSNAKIFNKHYKGAASKEESDRYFSIRP